MKKRRYIEVPLKHKSAKGQTGMSESRTTGMENSNTLVFFEILTSTLNFSHPETLLKFEKIDWNQGTEMALDIPLHIENHND